jgi:hypothetical protein
VKGTWEGNVLFVEGAVGRRNVGREASYWGGTWGVDRRSSRFEVVEVEGWGWEGVDKKSKVDIGCWETTGFVSSSRRLISSLGSFLLEIFLLFFFFLSSSDSLDDELEELDCFLLLFFLSLFSFFYSLIVVKLLVLVVLFSS